MPQRRRRCSRTSTRTCRRTCAPAQQLALTWRDNERRDPARRRRPMTMIQALRSAMDVMLERDDNVVVFGQDVGYFGGVFRCTEGLQAKYGKSRVFDAPISEGGIVGAAVGMGAYGLRPVVEIQFADYFYPASDQIVSEAARLRYRSAGDFTAPIDDPHALRRRHLRRPDAQPEPGGAVHPRLRPAHGDAVQPVRRQGPADRRRSRTTTRSSSSSPSASTTAPSTATTTGRSCRGPSIRWARCPRATTRCRSNRPRSFRPGARPDRAHLRHDGLRRARRRRARPASTPRSSTCAASGRSTWRRSSSR